MRVKISYVILLTIFISIAPLAASSQSQKSKYAGQETRDIKSLSDSDREELSKGQGWGLAKAAELNGVPGPAHVLELKQEISLNPEQVVEIKRLYQNMKNQAIPLGIELIELERVLNNHFADRSITAEILHESLEQIAQTQKQLRYVHLSMHLKTADLLTPEQIDLYNKLRGYSSDDPCKSIPDGHDPKMWKKHNNCP
ncbi:MAG: hypothetical protein KJO32_08520 [Deltaproteobacteria bacterium]|nr:hypothetical protein [Deltaproteobacteria bacterium]